MTARPKMAKTAMERQGFMDSDLKSPIHDQLVLDLARDTKRQKQILLSLAGLREEDYEPLEMKIDLEVPLTDRNFVLGFVDVKIECSSFAFKCEQCRESEPEIQRARDELSELIRQARVYYEGKNEDMNKKVEKEKLALRVLLETKRPCHPTLSKVFVSGFKLWIEVKSMIPGCGDLLRQLNFYRGHTLYGGNSKYAVLFPGPCSYADVLEGQGFYCLYAPVSKILRPVAYDDSGLDFGD